MSINDPRQNAQLYQAGTQLAQYTILEPLGRGGMGEVYKAEDTRLKRLVAIKVVRSSKTPNEQERLRLIREARASAALNHPNIVQVYGIETHDGNDCIVMEYVPGQTLRDVLCEGLLSSAGHGACRQLRALRERSHSAYAGFDEGGLELAGQVPRSRQTAKRRTLSARML
jgi:serine/threonine protein kinase